MLRALVVLVILSFSAVPAKAQESFWVQIEARQTLTEATERARTYAQRFDDVQGYYLGRGFYGIVLGPYNEQLARQELQRLLGSRQIPSDSYLQNGRRFEQQFWPIGGATRAAQEVGEEETPDLLISAMPGMTLTGAQESVAEARASEAALPREARQELQRALQWTGFYDAAIDGAFGRGTRRAMEDWQATNSQDPTGVLTTTQRALLLRQYNFDLESVGMELVRDDASGVQMQVPTEIVAFAAYQPPFAKFDPIGDLPSARVLFISQAGDAGRLAGLYEVLQVLDMMPPDGDRRLRVDSFFIEGVNNDIHSFATASVQNGEIKGFITVWPTGDERRRSRVLDVMQSSFTRLDGTLDPQIVPNTEEQAIDMVAGLAVRQPKLSRSGFYVSGDGLVATTPEIIDSCERITFDRQTPAEVVFADQDLGIALLRPLEPLVPVDVATFQSDLPRLQDRVAVAGYPFNGVLTAPTLTFGALADIRGLDGDDRVKRLSMVSQSSNAGGPVFDESGGVLGMLLSSNTGKNQALPPDVHFSLDAAIIVSLLATQSVTVAQSNAAPAISSVALSRKAANIAVLVSCW